jgi:tRNA(Arg) A34 adenosine deaminase TadA
MSLVSRSSAKLWYFFCALRSSICWAGIKSIYYGNTKKDAEAIGFGDNFIYRELNLPASQRSLSMRPMMRAEALQAFREWQEKEDKGEY